MKFKKQDLLDQLDKDGPLADVVQRTELGSVSRWCIGETWVFRFEGKFSEVAPVERTVIDYAEKK